MTFDQLQNNWQSSQNSRTINIDSDMLLREVKRNKKHFESQVFWRNVREVAVAVPTSLAFVYFALKHNWWPLFLMAFGAAFIAIFMIGDRAVQKRKRPRLAEPLAACVQTSLAQVDHQIWLLNNLLWWYFLPPGLGITLSMAYFAWILRELGPIGWILPFSVFALFLLVCWGAYWLNQCALRKELDPRRQELQQLLNSLKEN